MFPASSLEDWTPLGCGDDAVVTALRALAEECVHGRGYCRQVLCLYELSKVSPGPVQPCWGWGRQAEGRKVLAGALEELQRVEFQHFVWEKARGFLGMRC